MAAVPTRTCVGCRATAEKRDLVRIVWDAGAYVLDPTQTAPGRGAYLHPGCGGRALRTRAVQRALRTPARDSDELTALVTGLVGEDAAWAKRVVDP